MKISLSIMLAMVAITSCYSSICRAEWVHLSSNPEGELYADKYDIYRTENYAFFRSILNFREESDDIFPELRMKTNSTSAFNQIDCKDKTSETIRVTAYSNKFATGASWMVPKTEALNRKVQLNTETPIGKLAANACSIQPSKWTTISEFDGENELFIDFSSISKDKNHVKVNLMFNFHNTDITKIKSSLAEISFDCRKYTYALNRMVMFNEKFLNGQTITTTAFEKASLSMNSNEVEEYPSAMHLVGKVICQ